MTRDVVEGGFGGAANFNLDPLFFDGRRRNLRVRAGSPACDAGDLTLVPSDYFDFDGDGDVGELVPHDFEHTRRFHRRPARAESGRHVRRPPDDRPGRVRTVILVQRHRPRRPTAVQYTLPDIFAAVMVSVSHR